MSEENRSPSTADRIGQAAGGITGVLAGAVVGTAGGPLGVVLGGVAGAIGGWWTGRAIVAGRRAPGRDQESELRMTRSPERVSGSE